jgi:diguanylate cyclase (GGDEF)-like protein/PAS domain S-box-containing protein
MYIYADSVIYKGKTVRIASWTDVTEQEKLKNALQKSLEHNKKLTRFTAMLKTANQIIAKVKDEKKLFNEICYIARQYSDIRLACIGMPDENGLYKMLAKSGEIGYLEGIVISAREDLPEGQEVMGQVWRSKKPIFNFDFFSDERGKPWRKRAKICGIAKSSAIPVFKKGEIYAVIAFYIEEKELFDEDIKSVLLQLADDIGLALDRMDDEIRREDLRKFNELLLSNLTVGINVLRYPERVMELVNERTLQIYGASSVEDMVGHPMREFFPDSESYEKVGKLAETILSKGEGLLNDVPYLRLDGSLVYVDISGQKLPSKPGEPERIVWTEVDVTERHKSQETIRKLIELQEALLSNTATGIVLIRHPEKIIIEANRGFLNILGYSNKEEVLGHFTKDIFYPDDEESAKQMLAIIQEALIKGSAYLRDLKMKRKDGVLIYVDVSGQRIMGEQEHPLIVWTFMDVTERHYLAEELLRQSITDSLTNLPNRRALEIEFERAVERANRNKKLMAICMLDLDGFKQINDTYGHDAGDVVLKVTSERLQKGLRKTDFVARLGGDEFVLLIEYLDDVDTLEKIIDKIGELILEPIHIKDNINTSVKIGLSMGVVLYPFSNKYVADKKGVGDTLLTTAGESIELYNPLELIRFSDQALYEAKAHKADRSRFWTYYGNKVPLKYAKDN